MARTTKEARRTAQAEARAESAAAQAREATTHETEAADAAALADNTRAHAAALLNEATRAGRDTSRERALLASATRAAQAADLAADAAWEAAEAARAWAATTAGEARRARLAEQEAAGEDPAADAAPGLVVYEDDEHGPVAYDQRTGESAAVCSADDTAGRYEDGRRFGADHAGAGLTPGDAGEARRRARALRRRGADGDAAWLLGVARGLRAAVATPDDDPGADGPGDLGATARRATAAAVAPFVAAGWGVEEHDPAGPRVVVRLDDAQVEATAEPDEQDGGGVAVRLVAAVGREEDADDTTWALLQVATDAALAAGATAAGPSFDEDAAAFLALEAAARPYVAAGWEPRDSEPGSWLVLSPPEATGAGSLLLEATDGGVEARPASWDSDEDGAAADWAWVVEETAARLADLRAEEAHVGEPEPDSDEAEHAADPAAWLAHAARCGSVHDAAEDAAAARGLWGLASADAALLEEAAGVVFLANETRSEGRRS